MPQSALKLLLAVLLTMCAGCKAGKGGPQTEASTWLPKADIQVNDGVLVSETLGWWHILYRHLNLRVGYVAT